MVNDWFKWGVGELVGTFTLIFIGAGSICLDAFTGGGVGLVGIAFAHGLAIAVMVSALMHTSGGHLNPAVTISLVATGKMKIAPGVIYVIAQLLGAVLAALCLREIFPPETWQSVSLGATVLADGVTAGQGILMEGILTFFLLFVIWGTGVDSRGAGQIAGLAIGLTITLDILAGGGITGGSMNPARTFGPALVAGVWSNHFVYWIGPVLGGLAASFVYRFVLLKEE